MSGACWPDEWASWLERQGFQAGFGQSPTWARLQNIVHDAGIRLVDVEEGGKRVAGALLLHRKPRSSDHVVLRALRYGSIECVGGPVLPRDSSPQLCARLLDAIETCVAELGVSQLSFIAPPSAAVWPKAVAEMLVARGYVRSPLLTSLIDLSADLDAIFAQFQPAARKGVRKCERLGLAVSRCDDWSSYYHEFLRPFYSSLGHEGLSPRTEEVEKSVWEEQQRSGLFRFFVARFEGGPVLATLGTHRFNGLVTEIASGRTPAGLDNDVPAQDLLHWAAFRHHKEAGDLLFDMAGFKSNPGTAKEAGIRRFKEKWGGRVVEIDIYRRDFPTMANAVLAAGRKVTRLLRKRHGADAVASA